jgi:hypothetical protein
MPFTSRFQNRVQIYHGVLSCRRHVVQRRFHGLNTIQLSSCLKYRINIPDTYIVTINLLYISLSPFLRYTVSSRFDSILSSIYYLSVVIESSRCNRLSLKTHHHVTITQTLRQPSNNWTVVVTRRYCS